LAYVLHINIKTFKVAVIARNLWVKELFLTMYAYCSVYCWRFYGNCFWFILCTSLTIDTVCKFPLQLFSYPSISPVSAMSVSGVISPTNLSLFTSPVTTPRTTPRSTPIPRWNAPFISLDEDYNMITPLMSGNGNNTETNAGALIDDGMSAVCSHAFSTNYYYY